LIHKSCLNIRKGMYNEINNIRTYNVGVSPAGMAITSNGKYAYVCNSNNYSIPKSDSVTVLNLEKGLPELTINDPSFVEPYRVAIDRKDRFAYVCNSGSPLTKESQGTLTIINVRTNKVDGIITGFDGPGAIVILNKIAYVTNYGAEGGVGSGNGKIVSIVALKMRKIIGTIEVNLAPAALALSPGLCFRGNPQHSEYLYCLCYVDGNPGTGKLDIISIQNSTVTKTISGFFGPFGIAITKNGKYAYCTNFGSNNFAPYGTSVSVVDLSSYKIIKNIELGIQPAGIVISGHYVYVSNYNALYAKSNFQNLTYGQGTINIINTMTNEVIAPTIQIGQTPSTLTVSPNGSKLYVCNYVQNIVSEIIFLSS